MKNYSNLNVNEISVLKSISLSSDKNGGDFTYFSNISVEGLSNEQLKGYISQLSQKKYIQVEERSKDAMIFSGDYVDFLTEYEF